MLFAICALLATVLTVRDVSLTVVTIVALFGLPVLVGLLISSFFARKPTGLPRSAFEPDSENRP